MASFAGPAGIIAGLAGATMAYKRFAASILEEGNALDAVGKLSTRLGASSKELMALQFVAGQSGVSMEQLQTGLQAFNKRVGEAARGTGEAVKALEYLGINASEFAKLPLVERFQMIADRINGLSSETEKASVAAQLFSDVGKGPLLNMLAQGSDGIKQLVEQAINLGATLDDKTVKAIERANDAMAVQSLRMKGLKQQITGEVVPAIGYLAERWESLLEGIGFKDENSSLVRSVLDFALRGAPAKFQPVAQLGRQALVGGDILKEEEQGRLLDAQIREVVRRNTPEQMQPDSQTAGGPGRNLNDIWEQQDKENRRREQQIMAQLRAQEEGNRIAREQYEIMRRNQYATVEQF